jgi:hypothetical protein
MSNVIVLSPLLSMLDRRSLHCSWKPQEMGHAIVSADAKDTENKKIWKYVERLLGHGPGLNNAERYRLGYSSLLVYFMFYVSSESLDNARSSIQVLRIGDSETSWMTSETNVIRFDWIIVESVQMIVLKTLCGGDEPPLFFSQLSCSFQLPQVKHWRTSIPSWIIANI